MKKKLLILLLIVVSACASVRAQTFSLVSQREAVVSLDGLWRFHTGDNPQWASPTFDDSKWPLLRSGVSWTGQGYFTYSGYAWYRFTLQVSDASKPLSLLLPRIYTGYQVFGDGKLLGGSGSVVPTFAPAFAADPKLFRLPPADAGRQTVQIAIRVWEYRPIVSWVGGGTLSRGSAAGDPALLTQRLQWLMTAQRERFVNDYAYGLLATAVGLTILALFLLHRDDREYLWFSILLLAGAADAFWYVAGFPDTLPFLLFRLTDEVLVAAGVLAALSFFSTVLKTHRSFKWWFVYNACAVSPLSVAIYYLQLAPVGISYSLQLFCLLPSYLWIIAELTSAFFRRDPAARLLLAPAALLYGVYIFDSLAQIGMSLGWHQLPSSNFSLLKHPFPADLLDLVRYIFAFALLLFLVRRFSLARQEETRMSTELAAARSMQSLLVTATPPATPGFISESVYLPASEVGGDFFQLRPGDDGSLLIVVGDVSGKGLKAAMTVSAIVGALRGCELRAPAKVLAYLNRALFGQMGGFVTCCATLVAADGRLTIANAGHLSPYLNGAELEVASALPLGLADEVAYEEICFELGPGERLTFVSDGVVEARNSSGELYGFERTLTLCGESAQTIAETARKFGQEDDITVLTLTFAPAGVLHA